VIDTTVMLFSISAIVHILDIFGTILSIKLFFVIKDYNIYGVQGFLKFNLG